MEDWLLRTCELIDRYHPSIIYFDWWIEHSAAKPWLKKLAAYYYNKAAERGEDVVINYKHDAFVFGTAVPDVERGQFADIKPYIWQTDTAVARNSWGYTEGNVYKSSEELIWNLVDVVSKNGNFLLNIGPRADGTIPEEDARILEEIGAWLHVNGEAIYDTHPWRKYGEGPTRVAEGQFSDDVAPQYTDRDFRFTAKGDALYVISMKCSGSGDYCVQSLGELDASRQANFHGIIREVRLLGTGEAVQWTRDGEGLHLRTPVRSSTPLVFRLTLD
jgi:alpha-L-fucosidase